MTDKNCIHYKVCNYSGQAFACEKCKFRKYNAIQTNRQILDVAKFIAALEERGPDVCEHDDYYAVHGYSSNAIHEVVQTCQEHTEEVVGVCIEHHWAEEYKNRLISNFECPYCHEWHRQEDVDTYCSNCGKPIMIVHQERKKREG